MMQSIFIGVFCALIVIVVYLVREVFKADKREVELKRRIRELQGENASMQVDIIHLKSDVLTLKSMLTDMNLRRLEDYIEMKILWMKNVTLSLEVQVLRTYLYRIYEYLRLKRVPAAHYVVVDEDGAILSDT